LPLLKIDIVNEGTDINKTLAGLYKNFQADLYFISGSPSAIKKTRKILKSYKIKSKSIKSDPFYGYK
jgi:NAD(P)H-flavin reductase